MATTTTGTPSTGYVNGSDMLLYIGEKAVGHCSTHTTTFNSETKDHAVKPAANLPKAGGLWKKKSVTGLSISIKTDGLIFLNEEEFGYPDLLKAWNEGKSVKLKCAERSKSATPYIVGDFVITNLEGSHGAQDDSTYSASFENDGQPDTFDTSTMLKD